MHGPFSTGAMAAEDDGAGAASSLAAAQFGSCEAERGAEEGEEGLIGTGLGGEGGGDEAAVYVEEGGGAISWKKKIGRIDNDNKDYRKAINQAMETGFVR